MRAQILFYLIITFGTAFDLVSKWIVFSKFLNRGYVNIIPGYAGFVCSVNEGIAFGLFPSKGNAFIYFTGFAICAVLWIFYRYDKSSTLNTVGLAAVLSGAVGNLIDRIKYHSVRDFIDVHVGNYHWPTFNVADILICVGVGLLILKTFRMKEDKSDRVDILSLK